MAFDSFPGGDPRGPMCPKCWRPLGEDEPSTIMHHPDDPDGRRGLGGKRWHAECARPLWEGKFAGVLAALDRAARGL